MIITYNTPDDPAPGGGNDSAHTGTDADDNVGILILDATCALQNIPFPQDVNL